MLERRRSPWRWTLVAIAVSVLVAVVQTWPLATALGHAVPTSQWHCLGRGCEDEFLCVWIVSTLAKRLLHDPLHLFEGGILVPLKHTLAYSETMLTAVATSAPVTWLTGNHVLGYDFHYLCTVALSVLGTFLLVRDVTDDPRAALVAGVLFGLTGERWNYRAHLPMQSVEWVPFVCWTWIRFLDRPGVARAIALAAAMLANLHASVYQGFVLPLLLVPWSVVLVLSRQWPLRRWGTSAVVLAATLALGLVLYWPLEVVREELSFSTAGGATEVHGGWVWYLGAFLHPVAYLARLGSGDRALTSFSPLPVLMLLTAGIAAALRTPTRPAPAGERAHLSAAIAFMVATAAVTVLSTRLGPLGPAMDALFSLPGLDGLRGRNRFDILVAFGGAVVAGIALAIVLRRVRSGLATGIVLALAMSAIVVDTRTFRGTIALTWLPERDSLPPGVHFATEVMQQKGAMLHIPYGQWGTETVYMMWGLLHDRPIMNGYTAVMPRFVQLIHELPSAASRQALAEAGVTTVLFHTNLIKGLGAQTILRDVRNDSYLRKVTFGDVLVMNVGNAPEPRAPLEGAPLPTQGWRLEGSDPGAERAADGDVGTHWTAKTFGRPTFLRVDLGGEHRVTGIRLALGPHFREFPYTWEAWGSRDGSSWQRLGGERLTRPPFASYLADHRAIVLDLSLIETDVRMLELRVPSEHPVAVFASHDDGTWGVHELLVYARPETSSRVEHGASVEP
jgi:hypothetical protein